MNDNKISKNCIKCGISYYPEDPYSDLCYLCLMQPDHHPKKNIETVKEGCHATVYPHLNGSKSYVIPEYIQGQGFTGRLPGAHHNASYKRPPYRYKPKTCQTCNKTFNPSGALKRNCPKCDNTITRNRITNNNKTQRERRKHELILSEDCFKMIQSYSKKFGLTPSSLIIESLKILDKHWISVDSQVKTNK